uniref:Tripartite motif-containing protein 35-like n=1 Tax=Scophthalmus maximus TaxID=52904 RepID=A0A8D3ARU2_SCOMX
MFSHCRRAGAAEDLLCPQCCEIYRLPVLLKCGHNVCRVCLQKFWELKGCRECPVCRTVAEPGRPPINLPLKIAADEYQLRRSSRNRDLCFLHGEKLTLFCQNDEEPVCVVCHTSKQHKVHECCPVEEAAQQKKVDQEARQNEEGIKEEFRKLHLFLQEEENARLKVLKQEEEIKTQVMCEKLDNIQEQITTLSSTVSDTVATLTAKDLTFLQVHLQTLFTQH